MRRVMAELHPFSSSEGHPFAVNIWPAKWIGFEGISGSIVAAFRLSLPATPKPIRLHISADQRYELFLDGQRVGLGPERGDLRCWYFDTYELGPSTSSRMLVARVWWFIPDLQAPDAQMTSRLAFLCCAEDESQTICNTGTAAWSVKQLGGYGLVPPAMAWGTGAKLHLIGREHEWDAMAGQGDGWHTPVTLSAAHGPNATNGAHYWHLNPATLPPMRDDLAFAAGVARHVERFDLDENPNQNRIYGTNHFASEARAWDTMLADKGEVRIDAHQQRRVIVDLRQYATARVRLDLVGGVGSSVQVEWAESLFADTAGFCPPKGNRDEIEGKLFQGVGDRFDPDGESRSFESLWWHAGRYVQFIVRTSDEPLTIRRFLLRHTGYPFDWIPDIDCEDARIARLESMLRRTLEACAHETYMDCPYYEQLMYVGDTRLQALVTYALSGDDRLPRKALRMFDLSREPGGLTLSRYPSHRRQLIPPFSLWWVAMVHDFARWRGDREFVQTLMPGVRSVLDAFVGYLTSERLLVGLPGWNFMDWCPQWGMGVPPNGNFGPSSVINWQFVWVLGQAAELEAWLGEPELASRWRRLGSQVAAACHQTFWDAARGAYADDVAHQHFSQHAQCLAILSGACPADVVTTAADTLLSDERLAQCTIYFSHYLFEVFGKLGRVDQLLRRFDEWYDLLDRGLFTAVESPEPTRSDCHAWSSHPLYHIRTQLLGVQPDALGFESVRVHPALHVLNWCRGSVMTPHGPVHVDLRRDGTDVRGTVLLPDRLSGRFVWHDEERPLVPGINRL